MSVLTRQLFESAELTVRRQVDAHVFDLEESPIVTYFVDRSFPLYRVAAYFRSFAHLAILCGRESEWRTHANEAFNRLLNKRVLVKYFPKWYGVNINFLEWRVVRVKPVDTFDEQQDLNREPELRELLTECFISSSGAKILTADNREPFAIPTTDRGRDAGPAPSSETVIEPEETITPPASALQNKTDAITENHWRRLGEALRSGDVEKEFPEFFSSPEVFPVKEQCSPTGNKSVPLKGTALFPDPQCSPERNSAKPNKGVGLARGVPLKGTFPYIASSASGTKAELTSYNEKVVAAWQMLEQIDTTGGLKVKRFKNQWEQVCQKFPDYILNVLPNVIHRQIELHGAVEKPLALCAVAARADGKMR